MSHTSRVPFQSKPRGPDVDARIADAIEAVRSVEEHDQQRKVRVAERASALLLALDAGATLQELADHLGITPARVRQLSRGE